MEAKPRADHVYRFGLCVVSIATRRIVRGGVEQSLNDKDFDVLALLLENRTSLVSFEEFKAAIWPGVHVEIEAALRTRVSNIRKALGNADYILTASRKGYLVNPEVALTEEHASSAEPDPVAEHLAAEDSDPPEQTILGLPAASQVPPVCEDSERAPQGSVDANRWRKHRIQITALVVLILGSVGLWAWTRLWPGLLESGQPSRIRIQADTLFVLDEQGRELWHHPFPDGLGDYPTDGERLRDYFSAVDLDGGGNKSLIFIQHPARNSLPPTGARLVCFRGEKIVASIEPGRALLYGPDHARDRYTKPYNLNAHIIIIPGKPHPRIAVSSLHHTDAPTQVLILNHKFQILGEYWHPGHLTFMKLHELDQKGQGHFELLMGGVNNRHHSATVLALDPDRVAGTTRPIIDPRVPNDAAFGLLRYGDDEDRLQNLPAGTEKYVVLFPMSYFMYRNGHPLMPFNRVGVLLPSPGNLTVVVAESMDEGTNETILYNLDWQLNVLEATASQLLQQKQFERFEDKSIDHLFSKSRDGSELRKNVVVVKYN